MQKQFYLFRMQKSAIRNGYFVLLYCFAMGCVWFTFTGITLLFFIALLVFVGCFHEEKIISLAYDKKREWILELNNAVFERATLLASSVMFQYLCVLHFELVQSKQKKTLVLFPDNLSARDFPLLRRCVKMGFLS